MPRILVADDNRNIQKMVSLAFQDRGIEVTSVGNGEAAIRSLPGLNPDLILADIFMPVRNGYELCEWVKKEAQYSHIPVILLVGAFDPLDEKEARRVGADGVLKKPFIPPDPLIAMVTSVLEKNPRIAAEIAKAKEAPTPPPRAPQATLGAASKIEPKPSPELPDASGDDATLAYGFGPGRRGLDDKEIDEPAAARAPGAGSDTEIQEEPDGASTTNDWRRSAREFEIPEETARRPAFSSEEDMESAFPSEQNAATRHIRVPDSIKKIEPAAEQSAPPAGPEERLALGEAQLGTRIHADAPATLVPGEDTPFNAGSLETKEPDPDIQEVPAIESAAGPEPSFASRSSHWMDLMVSSPERPNRDWLSSVKTPLVSAGTPPAAELMGAKADQNVEELGAPEVQAKTEQQATSVAERSAQEITEPEEEPFFADEVETSEVPVAVVAVSQEPAFAIESFAEKVENRGDEGSGAFSEVAEDASSGPAPAARPGSDLELITESQVQPNLSKDPALIEPSAVHVTPEPLLVNQAESPSGPVVYGIRDQEVVPLYSFLSASPQNHASEESEGQEPAAEGTSRRDFPVQGESQSLLPEHAPSELNHRIPTGPPPDREALNEIPFLNPPRNLSEMEAGRSEVSSEAVDSTMVDALVQKIMERIEPQIRELLLQNILNPLVENLVRTELHKKDC